MTSQELPVLVQNNQPYVGLRVPVVGKYLHDFLEVEAILKMVSDFGPFPVKRSRRPSCSVEDYEAP